MQAQSRVLGEDDSVKNDLHQPLFLFTPKSGKDGIDADIIENSKKYYLYYKDEYKKTICHAVSDSLAGPYYEPENNIVCCTDLQVEGNCIYRINDTDAYIMKDFYFVFLPCCFHFLPLDCLKFKLYYFE